MIYVHQIFSFQMETRSGRRCDRENWERKNLLCCLPLVLSLLLLSHLANRGSTDFNEGYSLSIVLPLCLHSTVLKSQLEFRETNEFIRSMKCWKLWSLTTSECYPWSTVTMFTTRFTHGSGGGKGERAAGQMLKDLRIACADSHDFLQAPGV